MLSQWRWNLFKAIAKNIIQERVWKNLMFLLHITGKPDHFSLCYNEKKLVSITVFPHIR